MVRVACQQLDPSVLQPERNLELARAAVTEALAAGAELILLPELVTSGYVFRSTDEARAAALDPNGEPFRDWQRLLAERDALLVAGFPQLGADGRIYNSAAVIGAGGVLAVYRKLHLWDEEKLWFTPGDRPPPVLPTRFGRLGLLICYDLEFPETVRDLMLRGAELIAVPTNWPLVPRPEGERPPEIGNAMAAARLNRVFIACCDRVGTERGVPWTGGSCLLGPDGWPLAERPQRDRGLILADLDLAQARDKSWNRHNHVRTDRRPELYRSLLEPAQAEPR